MYTIRKIRQLLQACTSNLFEGNYVEHKLSRFTKPGENYGSLLLLLEIKYKDTEGQSKTMSLVAKQIPESEYLRMTFKIQISFKKELEFYNTILPTIRKFQKEQGDDEVIDFVPKFCAGRITLDGSSRVDEDAVILLENIKTSGYQTPNRTEGFDFKTTELILENLAKFHALPIALKLIQPETFKEKILPHLQIIPSLDYLTEESHEALRTEKVNLARENVSTAHLSKRVSQAMKRGKQNYVYPNLKPREPFATIRHNDFWANNCMIKYEGTKAGQNKIIDFQLIDYGSPACDVLFFLFCSVQMSVIKDNYDYFIRFYHDHFLKTLKKYSKCKTEEFSFQSFEREIEEAAKSREFFHLMGMLKPIYTDPSDIKEHKDMSEKDMMTYVMNEAYKNKGWYIIKEFAKRNWI